MSEYFKTFTKHSDYKAFINGGAIMPNVSLCDDCVHYNLYNNVKTKPDNYEIWYEASEKLAETTSGYYYDSSGLYLNGFNVSVVSHTFEDGKGVIEFDGDVEEVYGNAFINCSKLTSVEFPSSVTNINEAFINCYNLETVKMDSAVQLFSDYGTHYFRGCEKMSTFYYGGTVDEWNANNENIEELITGNDGVLTVHCSDGDVTINTLEGYWTGWLDSGKPTLTKDGGDIEPTGDVAGWGVLTKIAVRVRMFPAVNLLRLGQYWHIYGSYYDGIEPTSIEITPDNFYDYWVDDGGIGYFEVDTDRPYGFSGGFYCWNREQTGGSGSIPMPYSLNYEINVFRSFKHQDV